MKARKTRWCPHQRRWVRNGPERAVVRSAPIPREVECLTDLERMLDFCEARLAQTEFAWIDHAASTLAMDGNPASRGSGHGYATFGGQRRGKRRQRGATPSHGRYTGTARRPKGEGGAMNGRTADYTPRAYDNAVAWGSKRRRD